MPGPAFILATDLEPTAAAWSQAEAAAAALRGFAERALGVDARVELARLPARAPDETGDFQLSRVVDRVADAGAPVVFVLPSPFELNVWQRATLGEELAAARRRHVGIAVHHDAVDAAHPLLVDGLTDVILKALDARRLAPSQVGLLLVADGQGDPSSRADSYRLMRLLWEQLGMRRGDVGFIRHAQPFLRDVLGRCVREPFQWLLLPQCQWDGGLCDYARVMLDDHKREHPQATDWLMVDPPGDHPAIRAWLERRLLNLWQEKRASQAVRLPSARSLPEPAPAAVWSAEGWVPAAKAVVAPRLACLARARESASLAKILAQLLPPSEIYLVKATWHGYAQGTYTGASALDLLLGALPGRAVVIEGHTSSRNVGLDGMPIDWDGDARRHRGWIRRQDVEFLRRTGLADVLERHGAQYLNVTEAWWDGACAPADEVQAALGDLTLENPELAGFVPSTLLERRGCPLISFARFKGPTRLGVSNLFGLIPHPLRTAWHGPDVRCFASVCCDLARIYGAFFPLFGCVEAFDSAVRWNRKGLYRSRWGNYDLVLTDGLFTLSRGLVGADLLASRLQGQDVHRSGFFDVVRDRLGWSSEAAETPLPGAIQASLA